MQEVLLCKVFKKLNGCLFRNFRTRVISTHEMCLWLLFLSYLGKPKPNFDVLDFCSI